MVAIKTPKVRRADVSPMINFDLRCMIFMRWVEWMVIEKDGFLRDVHSGHIAVESAL